LPRDKRLERRPRKRESITSHDGMEQNYNKCSKHEYQPNTHRVRKPVLYPIKIFMEIQKIELEMMHKKIRNVAVKR
jgi:hypothetical protein